MRANKNFSQRNKVRKQDAVLQNEPQQKKRKQTKRQSKKRPIRKSGLVLSSERKTLEQLYLRGPASFWKLKAITKNTAKMSLAKVNSYLDTKPSFTKYRSYRMQFPRLKVIVKDINEIWSLDLAYVDNLAKYNRDVKYLLVAVDCLSRYLRVEPMKTKYATEAANAFKKMIKHKQPEKVWVDDGTEFLGAFKRLCNSRAIYLYSTFSEKSLFLPNGIFVHWKNIIHRYLEEKWTYFYIDKLEDFVKTINSRVNRITKLAPNKVTKKTYHGLCPWALKQLFPKNLVSLLEILSELSKKTKLSEKGYETIVLLKKFLR